MSDFIAEFRAAMAKAGMVYSGPIVADGSRKRFNCDGESGEASWYRLWHDHPNFANGVFGCWRRDVSLKWQSSNGSKLSAEELKLIRERQAQAESDRRTEEEKLRADAKNKVSQILSAASPATAEHPYLAEKRVGAYGEIRISRDGLLLLPMRDHTGAMQSCQFIAPDKRFNGRNKHFPFGLSAKGTFYVVSDNPTGPVVVCEGYATGASIFEATGWTVICCMMTANMKSVAEHFQKVFPKRTLIIAADNDRFTRKPNGEPWNPGIEKATEVAKFTGAHLAIPSDNLFSDLSQGTDFNDLALESGLGAVSSVFRRVCGMSFLSAQSVLDLVLPKNNLLLGDNVLSLGNLSTILAPGGTGKSSVLLQLAAAVCAHFEKFLAWEIHKEFYDLRWLIIQAENSAHRVKRDMQKIRAWIGAEAFRRFSDLVSILVPITDADSYLDLDQPEVFNRVSQSVELFNPQVVVFDALYNFSVRELSKGADMLAAVSNCQRISKRGDPSRVTILAHHALPGSAGSFRAVGLDRANYGRDSKVLHQLSRSVINIAPASEEDNSLLLFSCGKVNDGKEFSPFVVRRNSETLIYELDSEADVNAVVDKMKNPRKKEPAMNSKRVRELCPVTGASKAELSRLIRDDCGCTRESSYRYILKADKDGQIKISDTTKLYIRN